MVGVLIWIVLDDERRKVERGAYGNITIRVSSPVGVNVNISLYEFDITCSPVGGDVA